MNVEEISKLLESSLGEPTLNNNYIIQPDSEGRFWIYHQVVGSGEPLRQWIEAELKKYKPQL